MLSIDIEEGIKNFTGMNLSDVAKDIRYVKLETTDQSLIGNDIRNIFLEGGRIYVLDIDPFLKVFDAHTGKYLYNIGKKGQGPGELAALNYVDINAQEGRIILSWNDIVNQFNMEGDFLGAFKIPQLTADPEKEVICNVITMIDKNTFAGCIMLNDLSSVRELAAIVFDDKNQIISTLPSYDTPIRYASILTYTPFSEIGFFYRSPGEVNHFRGICDTIYRYDSTQKRFVPNISINYGKHEDPHNYIPGTDNPDLIEMSEFCESNRYFFANFFTKNASPEPYEEEVYLWGKYENIIVQNINCVLDKETNQFHFLLQPIPGLRGLNNDLDQGIPFFPKNVSSNNELVDYYQAFKFLEYAEKVPNPSESFKNFAESVDEEDNPIVIIAQSK